MPIGAPASLSATALLRFGVCHPTQRRNPPPVSPRGTTARVPAPQGPRRKLAGGQLAPSAAPGIRRENSVPQRGIVRKNHPRQSSPPAPRWGVTQFARRSGGPRSFLTCPRLISCGVPLGPSFALSVRHLARRGTSDFATACSVTARVPAPQGHRRKLAGGQLGTSAAPRNPPREFRAPAGHRQKKPPAAILSSGAPLGRDPIRA